MSPIGLYIHVPFCEKKCGYCDFVSFSDQANEISTYLKVLGQELANYRNHKFGTLYIGGGTPSFLNPSQFQELFHQIRVNVDASLLSESTVEANPESISPELLDVFKEAGINRLSFGLQSTSNPELERLGRVHSLEGFFEAFKSARSAGFSNINVDLMYGIPGQTLDDWKASLKMVLEVQSEHLSLYPLKIEEGTPFHKADVKVDENLQADMYLAASDFLTNNGFEHYEISNFCRPGFECRHNLNYWENGDYLGVGVSAASHLSGKRWKNICSLSDYISRIQTGVKVVEESSVLQNDDFLKEKLMLMLRLKEGVPEKLLAKWAFDEVEKFLRLGLAVLDKDNFKLTPRGWLLSNQLFEHLV